MFDINLTKGELKMIKPENIKEGMTITILEDTKTADRSYIGDIMEVLAVDLPFICVNRTERRSSILNGKLILDTRRYKIKQYSKKFVNIYRCECFCKCRGCN
jgi:hypothetical protein